MQVVTHRGHASAVQVSPASRLCRSAGRFARPAGQESWTARTCSTAACLRARPCESSTGDSTGGDTPSSQTSPLGSAGRPPRSRPADHTCPETTCMLSRRRYPTRMSASSRASVVSLSPGLRLWQSRRRCERGRWRPTSARPHSFSVRTRVEEDVYATVPVV
jgi:hypothetical protein